MFGERKEDGSVGNLFAEGVIGRLPDVIPTATIEVVRVLLKDNGIEIRPSLGSYTVRQVVEDLHSYNGFKGMEAREGEFDSFDGIKRNYLHIGRR